MWIEVVTSYNKNNVYTESFEYGLNGTEWLRFTPTEITEAKPGDTIGLNEVEWHRLNNFMFLNIKHPDIKDIIVDDYLKRMSGISLRMLSVIPLQELKDMRHLGPIRKRPNRDYRPQLTPDESLWIDGTEAWNTLGRNPQLIKTINHYIRDVLKLGYSIWSGTISPEIDELKERVRDSVEKVHPVIIMKLYDEKNNIYLDLADVGTGVSQVIPVLVGTFHNDRPDPNRNYLSKPPGGFFVIEEPELHLHPAAQVALGDVFIDSVRYNRPYHNIQAILKKIRDNETIAQPIEELFKIIQENRGHPGILSAMEKYFEREENSNLDDIQSAIEKHLKKEKYSNRDIQLFLEELSYSINSIYRTILIETHSEHLLLRFLRRVRETTEKEEQTDHILMPDDLSIVYVVPTSEGVEFIPLNVMDDGDFDGPWPEGFFDERLEELL
ncbi:MAG: ATP-binding protein [Gemmatimonadetes bacterium]|nr:ATP-binding protein [Gemmatimonadota bacterium]